MPTTHALATEDNPRCVWTSDEFDELTKLTLVETQITWGAEKLGRREWSASFSAQKQDHIRNTTTVRFEFGDARGKTRGTEERLWKISTNFSTKVEAEILLSGKGSNEKN